MGLFDSDGTLDGLKSANDRNRLLYDQIELPKYKEYVPQKYDNETANYKLTSDDPVMKSKQLEAIAQMRGLSSEGLNDADVAGFAKAREMGDQMAQAKTGAVMQDAQARGVAGGGMEFALREQGNQQAAQRAQEAALAQSAARSNQRAQYLQAYAGQLGQTRDQDARTAQNNSNVINQFNMANTQARNQTNASNVANTNQAFKYNEGLKDKNYENQMGKAGAMAGINTQEGQMTAAQAEAERKRQAALMGVAGGAIGGVVGGPAGAGIGYQIGSNV